MKTFLSVDPWDLMASDAAALLDRFSGELGATGVSVSLGWPAATRLRAPGHDPRVVQTRGGLFFHAGEDSFEATRLKPIVSSLAPKRDWLAQACAACHDRGLALRGSLSVSSLGRVAHKHRDMACRSAFGATSREGVCLVNPDVQAFYAALLGSMSEPHTFDAVVLTDVFFGWTEAWGAASLTPAPLGPVDRALLSICFCESCMQSAGESGVDALAARRSAAAMLDASFDRAAPADQAAESALADNAPFQAYLSWRGQAMSALWSRLARACKCDLVIDVGSNGIVSHVDCDAKASTDAVLRMFGQIDYGAVAGVMSNATLGAVAPPSRPGETQHGQTNTCACYPSHPATTKRRELRIAGTPCTGDHGPQLVTMMSRAAESGIATAHIDGAASLPGTALDSIRQAIRFVRRSG